MVGSSVPATDGACSEAGAVAGCPSPPPDGEGVGAAGAGAGLGGAGGNCGDDEGAVWAKAPAQIDEIRKDVGANKRGRNATEVPPLEVHYLHPACTNWRVKGLARFRVNSPKSLTRPRPPR
jgi:hypothetical protein